MRANYNDKALWACGFRHGNCCGYEIIQAYFSINNTGLRLWQKAFMEESLMQSIHQKMSLRYIKLVFPLFLTASFLLSGCGDSSQPSVQGNVVQSITGQTSDAAVDSRYYQITEKAISDPKTDFEQAPENRGKNYFSYMTDSAFADSALADAPIELSLTDRFSADGKLVLLYNITYVTDDLSVVPITDSYCLYVLDAPYKQWQCLSLSSSDWAIHNSDGSVFTPRFSGIAGISDDGVYLTMSEGIAFYGWDGTGRLLERPGMDAVLPDFRMYSADGTLYAISSGGLTPGSVTSYDDNFKPGQSRNLENSLCGLFSSGSESLWYGFDGEQNLTVWDKPNGTVLFSLGSMVSSQFEFLLTRTAAGEFILADVSGIWAGDGSAPLQKVFSFAENGYSLQELLALSANQDDSFSLVVRFEDILYLLTLEETEDADRQEITLVSSDTASLEAVIAAFNRQDKEYRVVLVNPFESGDINTFCQQMQLELSAGRGPDLMDAWIIDMEGCIQNGYIAPLDDIMENPSDYWAASMESGKVNGSLYGLTYRFLLSSLFVSESLAGDLDAWTLEQMMDAVQNSPSKALQMGLDSMGIVLQYGLADRDNQRFIDYGAGESHLAEQPFLDFLQYAKKYGDNLYYADTSCEEAADYYREGMLAALYLTMYQPQDFLFVSGCFQGKEVPIGMPAAQGRGIYVESAQICLNSNSPSEAGAKEFLRYLVSSEGQLKFHQSGRIKIKAGFSCRRDVTELLLDEYQKKAKKNADAGQLSTASLWGISADQTPLTDEQLEQFWALLESAQSEPLIPAELEAIVREELAPYFAGDCSAEEAAGKLDNRVQLYLDERK